MINRFNTFIKKAIMKKLLIILLSLSLFLSSKNSLSQNGAEAAAGIAAGIGLIAGGIISYEDQKERYELEGTEWMLKNKPEIKAFSLKIIDLDGKKGSDLSNAKFYNFKVEEYSTSSLSRKVLLCFVNPTWDEKTGVRYNALKWLYIGKEEWINMMVSYLKIASPEKDGKVLREIIQKAQFSRYGLKVERKIKLPFSKLLSNDKYLVTDYSDELKFVYNETSLGIYLKEAGNLIQIDRNTLKDMHNFLFEFD